MITKSSAEKQNRQIVQELDALKAEINVLNEAIAAREEKLQQQARAVQVGGESSKILQFIVEAESLSDIMGRVDVVSQLLGANKDLVQQQLNDQEKVVAKETETEEKQEAQMKLAAELESKKANLEQQQAEQEVLVASIASEKSQVASQKAEYVAQKTAAETRAREIQEARTVASETSSRSNDTKEESKTTPVTIKKETQAASKPAAPSVSGGSVIKNAYSVMGTRYSYGGTTTSGFDCSGFTSYAYSKSGKSLPRTASGQYAGSTRISLSQAKPGDLIFFNQTGTIDHVGIYLGNGQFIGAQTSSGVAVASFTSGYWAKYVVGFGRK